MRHTIRLSMVLAALAFSGCAAQTADETSEEFVASEAEAISASTIYKALVGSYESTTGSAVSFELASDRSFTLDTGIRCITTPCPSGEAGRWNLWSYRGAIYLELDGKGTPSRWFRVSGTLSAPTLVGVSEKGTWTKKVAEPTSGCAAILCAPDTFCQELPEGPQCITKCATVRCDADTHCDASSGAPLCVPNK